jgi:hypothetical protein
MKDLGFVKRVVRHIKLTNLLILTNFVCTVELLHNDNDNKKLILYIITITVGPT